MLTTDPKKYYELIYLWRVALIVGLIEKDAIIKWSERVIMQNDIPDSLFIDLALAGNRPSDYIFTTIDEFLHIDRSQVSGKYLFGSLYQKYVDDLINIDDCIKILYQIQSYVSLTENEYASIIVLEDDYAESKFTSYVSIEDVKQDLMEFFRPYVQYSLEEYSETLFS